MMRYSYIGLTDNLQRRFGEHRDNKREKKSPTNNGTVFWFYDFTCNTVELSKVERTWLNQYEIMHGKLPTLNKLSSPVR